MPILARSRWIHSAIGTGMSCPLPSTDVCHTVSKPLANPASAMSFLACAGSYG